MITLFNTILYIPLLNALVFIYHYIPDIGLAIIALTVLVRLLLWPLSQKSIASQKALQTLQPKMKEIQEKYKTEPQEKAKQLMALYKTEKINPASSCLPLLLQFPILIALYRVFINGFKPESLDKLYAFVAHPGAINPLMLGMNFLDLSQKNYLLAILAAAAQFWQGRMLISKKQPNVAGAKDEGMQAMMNKQMLYMMPVITLVIGFSLPGGLTLYWLMTTLLTILQQWLTFRKDGKLAVAPVIKS